MYIYPEHYFRQQNIFTGHLTSAKSRIDITGGYSYNSYETTTFNFADFNALSVKLPNTDPTFPFDRPQNKLISFFGRANYTYNNRYLLTATFRRDGPSRFAEENRWGTFPSVALAWKIKEESFLKNSNTFSDLKLKVRWGITGQQEGINYYDFLSVYSLSSPGAIYQFGNTYYQRYRPGNDNCNNSFGAQPALRGFAFSMQGQYELMKALTQEGIDGGGSGVIYWEPAWITSAMKDLWGTGSSRENAAFFDFNGNAIQAWTI